MAEQSDAAAALSALSVGVVQPVYPPHFPLARLFLATARWCGARLAYFPTFSSDADLFTFDPSWAELVPRLDPKADRLVAVPLVTAAPSPHNPATFKKWHGLRIVFSNFASIRFALTLDAETAFVSDAARLRASLDLWAAQRTVFGSRYFPSGRAGPDNVLMQSEADRATGVVTISAASCGVLGLPPTPPRARLESNFFWWSDAPVYDRDDFDAFWPRVKHALTPELSWRIFDHAAYLCFKLLVQNWTLASADRVMVCPNARWCQQVEYATLAQQRALEKQSRGYHFLWTRAFPLAFRPRRPSPDRLLMFHLNRMHQTIGYSSLRAHFANCTTRAACERQGRAAWALNQSAFRCSAPRVAAHLQAMRSSGTGAPGR
jgi:hypothetical protein